MEKMFLLSAADVSHVTAEDAVKGHTVPVGRRTVWLKIIESRTMLTLWRGRLTLTRTVEPQAADAGGGRPCFQKNAPSDSDIFPASSYGKHHNSQSS